MNRVVHNQHLPEAPFFLHQNDSLDEILRGEISAVEAYKQVMDKFKEDPEITRLESIYEDHVDAVAFWKTEAEIENVIPEQTSGIWGKAVEAFVGTSKLLGNTTALRALREGEEHGLKLYQELLNRDNISEFQKEKIKRSLIPNQELHLVSLDALIEIM